MKLSSNNLYIIGTYFTEGRVIYVNAKLVQADGIIVRAGQIILYNNQLTQRLLAGYSNGLSPATLEIRAYNNESGPATTPATPVDYGMDIH